MIPRRSILLALLVGACGKIVKGAQEQQRFSDSSLAVSLAEMEERWRHWTVTVPKTLTVTDPETKTTVVLTATEIMDALRLAPKGTPPW